MDVIKMDVQSRGTGKKAVREVRREGNVPCVLYGHNVEPVVFQVAELSLKPLIFTDETHTVEMTVDGTSYNCILKEVVFHPVTDRPIHADFQALQEGETLTLTVPVRFLGKPVGQVDQGGDVNYVVHELEVTCLPKDIPSHLDIDITHLNIGDSLHVSDLAVPEGVEINGAPGQTIVTVLAPRVEAVEPDEAAVALGLAEGEEGELDEEGEEEADA